MGITLIPLAPAFSETYLILAVFLVGFMGIFQLFFLWKPVLRFLQWLGQPVIIGVSSGVGVLLIINALPFMGRLATKIKNMVVYCVTRKLLNNQSLQENITTVPEVYYRIGFLLYHEIIMIKKSRFKNNLSTTSKKFFVKIAFFEV
jgi:MFS superfamily sulfate permease-like transporter